jgi:tetratricopeptide (TPR) repeat protein
MADSDLTSARTAFTEMHDILRRLAVADPDSAQAARDLSIALERIGDVAITGSDPTAARTAYSEKLDIDRRLATADPDNVENYRNITIGLNRLGQIHMALGDLAAARAAHHEGLGITRRLAALSPLDMPVARDLSVALIRLGEVAMADGDLKSASSAFIEGLGISRRVAAADPANALAMRELCVVLGCSGYAAMVSGDYPEARNAFRESLDIARRLVAADTSNAHAVRVLSMSLEHSGDIDMATGDLAAAQAAYAEKLALDRQLAAADPGNAENHRHLAAALTRLGQVSMAGGELTAARAAYTEGMDIALRLTSADPGNAQTAGAALILRVHLAELAELEYGEASEEAQCARGELDGFLDEMEANGWITASERCTVLAMKSDSAVGGIGPRDGTHCPPNFNVEPVWEELRGGPETGGFNGGDRLGAPSGSGGSPDVASLVTSWLVTETWNDSFAFLRAHQNDLASPNGRLQVRAQAADDDTVAALHLGVLDMAEGGVPLGVIEQIVTDIDAATSICVRTLADGQTQAADAILSISDALMHSPRGLGVQVAIFAVASPEDACTACAELAAADPDIALAVADELDTLAAQIASAGSPIPNVAAYVGLLRT